MPNFALIDFETTGLSPDLGDRPTEIAVLVVREGVIAERFATLMNPGRSIPYDVQALTGITPAMVANAPTVASVMAHARALVGTLPIVAHNAAFDRRFWQAELARCTPADPSLLPSRFGCTMLVARRLYPEAPTHQLGTLVRLHRLPAAKAHRALADAEMTFSLWEKMNADVKARFGVDQLTFEWMQVLQKAKRDQVAVAIDKHRFPKVKAEPKPKPKRESRVR